MSGYLFLHHEHSTDAMLHPESLPFLPLFLRTSARASRLLATLILLFGLFPAAAVDTTKPISELMHQSWSVDDGLPHSTIRDLAQTADGHIWFATHEGVARFDSLQFKVFDLANTPALRGGGVIALLSAKDGSLYLGLREGGLTRYVQGRFETVKTEPPLPAGAAYLLAEDAEGGVWLGLRAAGVARIVNGKATLFNTQNGLPSNTSVTIRAGKSGDVWIGTTGGIALVRKGVVVQQPTRSWLDSASIADILVDAKDRLWVATANEGLAVKEGDTIRRFRRAQGLATDSLTRLIADASGGIWFGSIEGLHRIVPTNDWLVERFTTRDGLSNNHVRSLLMDREGGIWVGTDQGANRLRESLIITWGAHRGITEPFTRAVIEDRKGRVWIATADGLFVVTPETTRRYTKENGLLTSAVLSLAEDPSGAIWIGTNGGGLHRMIGERIELMSASAGVGATSVRAILPATDGGLWIGTNTGLIKWSWKKPIPFVRATSKDGRVVEQVTSLIETRDGEIWVGTSNGLGLVDRATAVVDLAMMAVSQPVLSLNTDQEGEVWVNFASYGVGRIVGVGTKRRLHRLAADAGIPEQSYFAAIDDHRGSIWLCSTRGIVKISKSQAEENIAGKSRALQPEFFNRADGMASTQCNGASQPAGTRLRDGRLIFPTARGLAVVDPAVKSRQAKRDIPLHIRNIIVDGAPLELSPDGKARLPAGSHRFEVNYVGMSFSEPEKVRYRYRLDGFDTRWIDAQRETKAVFTNLDPGTYVFHAASVREGGEWNAVDTAITVVQEPHFYQTIWFRWALLLGVLAIGFAIYRARIHHLESQRALLRETVVARTQELETEKQKLEAASNERAKLLVQVADSARAYEKLSKEDSLTGLANRRQLDAILAGEFSRAARNNRPLTVALGDLDFFKKVNDQYSHAVGDEVLRSVAAVLREGCRAVDTVGRYGGEEFVFVFPEAHAADAIHVCERLRVGIARIDWPGKKADAGITMSFGVAELTDEATFERLLARADKKLYEAKAAGRNRVVG